MQQKTCQECLEYSKRMTVGQLQQLVNKWNEYSRNHYLYELIIETKNMDFNNLRDIKDIIYGPDEKNLGLKEIIRRDYSERVFCKYHEILHRPVRDESWEHFKDAQIIMRYVRNKEKKGVNNE